LCNFFIGFRELNRLRSVGLEYKNAMPSSQKTYCACLTKTTHFVILRETAAVCRGNQTDRTYSVSSIQGLGPRRSPQPILSALFPTEYSITLVSFDFIDTEIPTELIAHSVQRVATVWTVRGSNADVDKTSCPSSQAPAHPCSCTKCTESLTRGKAAGA
jgi:hypothetical protein